jgi:hypothetical protein
MGDFKVTMTQDALLGQLRLIMVGVLAYAAGKGWLSSDTLGLFSQVGTPLGLLAGPWIWSVYVNINKKLVRVESVVIDPIITSADQGKMQATVITPTGAVTGVIKVLIVCVITSGFLMTVVHAQTPLQLLQQTNAKLKAQVDALNSQLAGKPASNTTTSSNGLNGVIAKLQTGLDQFNQGVTTLEKGAVDKAITDVNTALLDASNHNDQISLPCWQSNLTLLQGLPIEWPSPPETPIGIATAIQLQRDLLNGIMGVDKTSLKVACAALWGDQIQIITQVGALLGVKIALGGL